jgi:hypothetical protein
MISPADSEKMLAQIDAIDTEVQLLGKRLKIISADLARIREKLL